MQDGPESCKHLTQCMLDGLNTETSEVDYTTGLQRNTQMAKPSPKVPMQPKTVANID